MALHLILFAAVTLGVGAVNLTLSEPLERSFPREYANYAVVVGGGIVAFTGLVMLLSSFFL